MSVLLRKSLDSPDESRTFGAGMGHLDVVTTDDGTVGRAVFEPGWRWSDHVEPIAGTDSCEAAHTGYVISGQMRVVMDDGRQEVFTAGDLMVISPGHDAWIIGSEPCVVIDWQGFADYAKASATAGAPRT
jgi:quercetin dioxygenase-like cupin family protein